MQCDKTLLDGSIWKETRDLSSDATAIQEFENLCSLVHSVAVVVAADIEQLKPFVCGERVSDHAAVALHFDFERLATWVDENLLKEFKDVVQLRLRRHQQESALKAFGSAQSLVKLCLSGAHNNWKTTDAQSLVAQLPSAAGGLADVNVIGVIASFALVGGWVAVRIYACFHLRSNQSLYFRRIIRSVSLCATVHPCHTKLGGGLVLSISPSLRIANAPTEQGNRGEGGSTEIEGQTYIECMGHWGPDPSWVPLSSCTFPFHELRAGRGPLHRDARTWEERRRLEFEGGVCGPRTDGASVRAGARLCRRDC